VKVPALLRPARRLWPQKVRTRLTLLYAGLFLAAGVPLLALTYGLVASSLPSQPSAAAAASTGSQQLSKLSYLSHECNQAKGPAGKVPVPASLPPGCLQLKQAYNAGTAAGLQSQRERTLSKLLLSSLVGLAVMTAASGGMGWFMSGHVLRPLRVITETARRASEEHLGERLALTGASDELKELADTFDDMLERLDAAFAGQRRFVASASHELRTPLAMMRTAIDVTLAKPSPTAQQLTDMAVRVRRSVDRAEAMIEALLTLAVSDQGRRSIEPADLATCAEDAIDDAAHEIARLDLRVDTALDPAQTTGDPQLLERMISNLVRNAVRHNQPGGWIRLRTGTNGTAAYLRIANSGPHIPDDAIPTLFEPFRRMQPPAGVKDGVGLGLSIARSVATAHHATVTTRSQPAGGLDITITIPHHPAPPPHPSASPQP
jgi:signal transduction histidine kinase